MGILGVVEGAATGGTAALVEEAVLIEDMGRAVMGRGVVVSEVGGKVNDEGKDH